LHRRLWLLDSLCIKKPTNDPQVSNVHNNRNPVRA
jgi:hypothetical protein